jgi:hypothetical protein
MHTQVEHHRHAHDSVERLRAAIAHGLVLAEPSR